MQTVGMCMLLGCRVHRARRTLFAFLMTKRAFSSFWADPDSIQDRPCDLAARGSISSASAGTAQELRSRAYASRSDGIHFIASLVEVLGTSAMRIAGMRPSSACPVFESQSFSGPLDAGKHTSCYVAYIFYILLRDA